MNRYKKGVNTCNYIVEEAKKIFYEKGYCKTTIQEICDNTNITLGNFTYYFKTKQDLLRRIYVDYIKDVESFVMENTDDYPDPFDKYLIVGFVYNYRIFADEKISNFNKEIIEYGNLFNDIFLKIPVEDVHFAYGNITKNVSKEELYLLYLSDLGIRKELTLFYVNNRALFNSPFDFSAEMAKVVSRIYSADDERIREKFIENEILIERIKKCEISLL